MALSPRPRYYTQSLSSNHSVTSVTHTPPLLQALLPWVTADLQRATARQPAAPAPHIGRCTSKDSLDVALQQRGSRAT